MINYRNYIAFGDEGEFLANCLDRITRTFALTLGEMHAIITEFPNQTDGFSQRLQEAKVENILLIFNDQCPRPHIKNNSNDNLSSISPQRNFNQMTFFFYPSFDRNAMKWIETKVEQYKLNFLQRRPRRANEKTWKRKQESEWIILTRNGVSHNATALNIPKSIAISS